MSDEKGSISIDVLGAKHIAETTHLVVEKSFQGVEGFLRLVCAPALEEVGLMARDQVKSWRLNNTIKILEKAKGKLQYENGEIEIHAHPRVALSIIENGSLNDNDEIRDMWAGLFASSCTKSGQEDENLIFVDLLKQLTVAEAKILKYSCENAIKVIYKNGLICAEELEIQIDLLKEISGIIELHRLDRELDHLFAINLIGNVLGGGFNPEDDLLNAKITPTSLALNLYVKCQGFNQDQVLFWKENIISKSEKEK